MNIIEQIKQSFEQFLSQTFSIDENFTKKGSFSLNVDPAKQQFGDINSNHAMVLTKELKRNPRQIAETIANDFSNIYIEKIEIAGPGFLNFHLTEKAFKKLAQDIFENNENFFKLAQETKKKNFNIEFVSANPTGPLHLGHGRGAIIGDVLGNICKFIGHKVTQEFYINDAGAQITKLGKSFKARCQQASGLEVAMPEDGYQGQYLADLAKELIAEHGNNVLDENDVFFATYAKERMLLQQEKTLGNYGVIFDTWFSEKQLHDNKSIEAILTILDNKEHLYTKDDALWFKSTNFGDDKDRVIRKKTGDLTYIAADIAYMKNKVDRNHDHLIMILGHDHHSYVTRLEGLRQAQELSAPLDVILYQLVRMKASGEFVRMSKRAGNIVTLKEVIKLVGKDVARFFYLNRKADAQLEFDLELALKKTDENPVFYAQYAYVRTKSILNKALEIKEFENINIEDIQFLEKTEHYLLKKIIVLKELLTLISKNYQTHLLTYYVVELAQEFHKYYAQNRVINMENLPQSRARLLMITLLKNTLQTCLTLIGISKPEKM